MTVTRLPNTGGGEPDRLFADTTQEIADFAFDNKTAEVFDDMVGRSVPFYDEIQRMVGEIAADFAEPGTMLYDLGCSTATTLLALDPVIDPSVGFVGVDNAPDMLAKAEAKIKASKLERRYDLIQADLHHFSGFDQASVVTMVLTLMFIRPLHRLRFMERLYRGLRPGGCLVLVEKLTVADSTLNRLFINHYYDYKRRNDYSDLEITRKREALENVLIPYRLEENVELLRTAGFRTADEFFRWYNFGGLIAVK
jgi:tRNA (cmo5U34)-methyltransferase